MSKKLKKSDEYHPIFNRIIDICDNRGTTVSNLLDMFTTSRSAMNAWKKGNINAVIISEIAEFLNVSVDYLVNGKERAIQNVSQSAITLGNHSTSTVNISSQETTPSNYIEALPEKIDTFPKSENDEMVQEIARILNKLPLRERTKLLSIVYNFEEQYQKTQNENKIG